ncbi:transglutaminase domain-containing protein [Stenotrophomonas cyclobalanopsidis]|uniref:Transglutaminase domain-containing protein n=1 Tax=Stenotrophomonas cyclobalanopsidis TaxID=2771362 RepID=A0ABQ6SXX0_9GAMM|nr:transglutaminase-like domain-containing protein [Stenotrophomonas cyclobalanopsidis]KAA8995306.1 transglutaminase domain-containing protein [Stenotrophomonas cyclobalanopsidis]
MDPVVRKLRLPAAAGLCAVLLLWASSSAAQDVREQGAGETRLIDLVDSGRFALAEGLLARGDLPVTAAWQRERMRRIRLDFSLDEAAAIAAVRRWIPDLTDAEFARWDQLDLIEHLDIDGTRWYFKRAPSNLFRLSDEARARRRADAPLPAAGQNEVLNAHHARVVAAADQSGETSVLPQRIAFTQSLTVKADAVPAGETIRAWIPYPREIPGQQEQVQWLGSTPGKARVAPASTLQRTAYLEAKAVAGQPTRFEIRYAATIFARHTAVDPARVQATPADPALQPFLAEQLPHVRFTPALKLFSDQVLQGETRPYEVVRRLYAAVDRIPWAGAREYSTLSNISDYALRAGHADCGQQTLLLIALLRMNGIPARWQSGRVFSDDGSGYSNLHDWGAVYLAPYGWLPMDVTTGALASETPALRDFYLGGLDGYRIAFNDDFGQPFVPAKQHYRSETVDSQRGEAEWAGGNLYFDQWDDDFQWRVLPAGQR